MPGSHHQDLLGVVVQCGDTGRHADSEGQPGHAEGDREGNLSACVDTAVQNVCNQIYILGPFRKLTSFQFNSESFSQQLL